MVVKQCKYLSTTTTNIPITYTTTAMFVVFIFYLKNLECYKNITLLKSLNRFLKYSNFGKALISAGNLL